MATNWVDEVLSGATSTGSKTLSLATGNALSVANSSSESIFTVTSDTTNGGYTSILGIEGQEAVLFLGADNADDAGDSWEIHADTSGNFKIGNRTSGTGSPTRSNTFTNSLTIDSSRNITVGVDDTGYDVKFFGANAGNYMLWDASADKLIINSTDDNECLILTSTDISGSQGPTIVFEREPVGQDGADNDQLGACVFKGYNDGTPDKITYAQITSNIVDATDGTEAGKIALRVQCGSSGTNLVSVEGSSTDGVGSVTIGGGLIVGANSSTQGTLSLWDGGGGNTPGYIVLYSPNGTANYIFCEDDGTLKRHTSAPTANANGSEIGGQS